MTLAELKALRDKALQAYTEALEAQSLSMNGRNLTRQNIDALKNQFDYWERRYKHASGDSKPYKLVCFLGVK
ncbi:hypothetical protein P2G74_01510 [Cronobacter muytjensii]|uniref:hypothetical protein n=1 Tax=Cronobacter muytjensii TaxID=413501 RepID=UPI002DB922C3|nr:hypothetical protein [Cronobacter muytjensii]MEB8638649.1 hypothetical protein [Cronobacter muytjensii]